MQQCHIVAELAVAPDSGTCAVIVVALSQPIRLRASMMATGFWPRRAVLGRSEGHGMRDERVDSIFTVARMRLACATSPRMPHS
jgi:hypothetical protein